MNARADRFFLVDSLRGVAALMVLAVHVSWLSGAFEIGTWSAPYFARLEAAFAMFFAISGFLLYRPFVRARLLGEPPLSAKAYGWRRFLRIVPAFWVALVVIALWLGDDLWSGSEILRQFGFLQLYYGAGTNDVIPQAWTLSVEIAFYALLPLWAALMRRVPGRDFQARLRGEVVAVSALVVGSLAFSAVLLYSHAITRVRYSPQPLLASLPGYMDHIALGMLLAVVSVWVLDRRDGDLPQPLRLLARFPSIAWAIAVLALVVGALTLGLHTYYTPTEYMVRHLLNSVVAVAVLIPAVFGDPRRGLTRRILGTRAIVYVGLISYGFYLFHWAVIQQLFRWKLDGTVDFLTSYWVWFLASLVGALVLGSLSYYLVERPALSLKRLVPPRPRQRDEALAEPAPAAPVTAPPAG
ncbi:MAG TPA: acyltransferase [Thermoleophilaceae bacterium]|nr:acyltransferase [Thermoleophilaceae bacterium]